MPSSITESRIIRWAAFFVLLSLIIHFMVVAKTVLLPLIFAGFVAVLFSPVSTFLEQKISFPRWLSAIICLLLAIIIIGGVMTFFYFQAKRFSSDLDTMGSSLNELLNRIANSINQLGGGNDLVQLNSLEEAAGNIMKNNKDLFTKGLAQISSSFIQILLFMTLMVLFLIYRDEILNFLLKVIRGETDRIKAIIIKVKKVVRNYIIGIFLVVLILAVFNSIALVLMDIKHAIFFAVFAAMLNIVPFIGPIVGSVLPAIFALVMKDSLWYPFGVVLYFITIQIFESYLITPNIVGRRVSINPMFTILAIFVGNLV